MYDRANYENHVRARTFACFGRVNNAKTMLTMCFGLEFGVAASWCVWNIPALLLNYSFRRRADEHLYVNVFVCAYMCVVCLCKAKEEEDTDRHIDKDR